MLEQLNLSVYNCDFINIIIVNTKEKNYVRINY